jgi:hypothetical protein
MVPAERAEGAVLHAHVGEVDVAVHHEGDEIARLTPTQLVGGHGERQQIAPAHRGQRDPVLDRYLGAVQGAAQDPPNFGGRPAQDGSGATRFASAHGIP